jgi:CRISPR-associated endonuclease Cas1
VLRVTDLPWVSVCGYGAQIKSTQKNLLIQKKNSTENYPLDSVKNLLIVGGHTISSTTVNQLIKRGVFISFFESDGTPVGTIRPCTDESQTRLYEAQKGIPPQRFAVSIAQGALKSRIFAIERAEDLLKSRLFYEGEREILHNSLDEMAYLIKLEEIRRLHRLVSDMYYEIMARSIPGEIGFHRRTLRPQTDPVNAMLSFGYALLFGTGNVSIIGSRLDPDHGFMHAGKGSLVQDLIEPLKAGMVDSVVFNIARESLQSGDYEISQDRCMLSEDLMRKMMLLFYTSANNKKINDQVLGMLNAISNNEDFKVQY